MNKKSIIAIGLFVLAICAIQFRNCKATATTHIWAPSTDVQGYKVWHITSDVYIPVKEDANHNRLPATTNIGLTVGILPFKKINAELGIDHKSGLAAADHYPFYGNLKIGAPENAFGGFSPSVAVGIFDVGSKKDFTNFNIFYGKVAKSVQSGNWSLGRFSLGYFSGNNKLLINGQSESDNSGIIAAWERTFPELSDKFWFCVEYMGTKSVYGSLNIGIAWKFASNVSVLGGYEFYNNTNLINTATLQVDIDY
ncbi:MAG TPA: hypothetical protein DEO84_05750 [candidate division Zixibacteria bacterium]|nr:hypothetical protein [candidate division Zixibacteria bacterium]HBZ00810.1 hypothetical protein [candidate division Zixibacteria bacterium]